MLSDCQILAEELQAEEVTDRRRAARMLAMLAEEAQSAALALLHAVSDADEEVRNWSAEALEMLGPPRPTDADSIANLAQTSAEADVQYFALVLLSRLGKQAEAQKETVQNCLAPERSVNVRVQAIKTLSKITDLQQKSALREALLKLKSDSDPRIQAILERVL